MDTQTDRRPPALLLLVVYVEVGVWQVVPDMCGVQLWCGQTDDGSLYTGCTCTYTHIHIFTHTSTHRKVEVCKGRFLTFRRLRDGGVRDRTFSGPGSVKAVHISLAPLPPQTLVRHPHHGWDS